MNKRFTFNPIGITHSCFTEKFGIPRQPGLVPAARATLEILKPYDRDEAFRGIDEFSHLWIVFVFHGIPEGKWRPTVRPPRLGGNRRTGVFATRSGFRPNPIGMSAVRLEKRYRKNGTLFLDVSGIDLLDRTPIVDLKPYLPYADVIPNAVGGFAIDPPRTSLSVEFTDHARRACIQLEIEHPGFTDLLIAVLKADPRPAYVSVNCENSEFGMRLYDVNINWTVRQETIVVHTIGKTDTRNDHSAL